MSRKGKRQHGSDEARPAIPGALEGAGPGPGGFSAGTRPATGSAGEVAHSHDDKHRAPAWSHEHVVVPRAEGANTANTLRRALASLIARALVEAHKAQETPGAGTVPGAAGASREPVAEATGPAIRPPPAPEARSPEGEKKGEEPPDRGGG